MSCSLIKASNPQVKNGFRFYPDVTISNADKNLLSEFNQNFVKNLGIISPIKGGFNLKFRGKRKVKLILNFFEKYPLIAGHLTLSKLFLMKQSLMVLESRKTRSWTKEKKQQLELIRAKFVHLKQTNQPLVKAKHNKNSKIAIGYFLSGMFDAEGSVGFKKNGSKKGQPFFAIAMKERDIINLFYLFLKVGHLHERPYESMLHFEIGAKSEVLLALDIFLNQYPSRLRKMRRRMLVLQQRILNDYTPGSPQ